MQVHGEKLHCAWGLVSRSGWSVVDDSVNWALTKGAEWWDSVNTNDVDLYLLAHGHNYKAAIKDFAKISGSVPMFPRYALGIWVSCNRRAKCWR
jgi:alpha-glucosidase (family GH31 glycosyl hydrolase)